MINFMKFRWIYTGLSGGLILLSIISLILWGLKPSIDFVGGALLEIKFPERNDVAVNEIREKADSVEGVDVYSITFSDDSSSYQIRTNSISESKKVEVENKLGEIAKIDFVNLRHIGV